MKIVLICDGGIPLVPSKNWRTGGDGSVITIINEKTHEELTAIFGNVILYDGDTDAVAIYEDVDDFVESNKGLVDG